MQFKCFFIKVWNTRNYEANKKYLFGRIILIDYSVCYLSIYKSFQITEDVES